ncbi:MAG: thiol reductase thioredoxin, partial [gamma proteobacterium symbiont of Stewartia floridana]
DFWAPWCGPCRMMAPAFEAAAKELEPQVRLIKVNTEEAQRLGAQYAIRSIPTLMLIHQGRELARQAGAMDRGGIIGWARRELPGS